MTTEQFYALDKLETACRVYADYCGCGSDGLLDIKFRHIYEQIDRCVGVGLDEMEMRKQASDWILKHGEK